MSTLAPPAPAMLSVAEILDKAVGGERLSPADGLQLLRSRDLAAIGSAADAITRQKHPGRVRTYNIDRNINYTNVCTAVCDFCAFYRGPKSEEGYVLPREVLLQKVGETVELGGNQILLQGGLHPKFKLDWYEQMLRDIRAAHPSINIHGFSPPEIHHFTKVNRLPLVEVLTRLKRRWFGQHPRRWGGDPGRSRSRRDHPRQSDDGRLARRHASVAPLGRTQQRDDDVRPRRNARRADRAFGPVA